MEGAGILLIAIAIALMLVPPIHVTIVQPLATPAAIGTMVPAQYDHPSASPGPDDMARRAASVIAGRPDAAETRAPD